MIILLMEVQLAWTSLLRRVMCWSYSSNSFSFVVVYSVPHCVFFVRRLARACVHGETDESCSYPAIRSIGRDTKFTVSFCLSFFYVHLVEDFSAGALPIGVKFCVAVWPDLLLFLGDSRGNGQVLGVNRGHMAGYASFWSTCFESLNYFSLLMNCSDYCWHYCMACGYLSSTIELIVFCWCMPAVSCN